MMPHGRMRKHRFLSSNSVTDYLSWLIITQLELLEGMRATPSYGRKPDNAESVWPPRRAE